MSVNWPVNIEVNVLKVLLIPFNLTSTFTGTYKAGPSSYNLLQIPSIRMGVPAITGSEILQENSIERLHYLLTW
jgi:hypothetical protein